MSKIVKISSNIKNYVLSRKRKNPDISCRVLSKEASDKFNITISKSSVNAIIKSAKLSSPIGRKVTRIFRPAGEADGVGYAFLLAANYLLGFSKILANSIKKTHPSLRVKFDTLETISEAWIMAKALYNVPLEKIENYSKNDLWFITGRKANKGLLKRYIDSFNIMQLINLQVLSDISHVLQDVHYLKFHLADGSQYFIDGQMKSVWKQEKIPIDFCTTVDIANSYISRAIFGSQPLVIFNAFPETMLGDEISDFIFSIDGASSSKRIRKIELISPQGVRIKEIPFVVPSRRKFILGVWPWQYKTIAQLEKIPASGSFFLEAIGREFYFNEENIRFVQHVHNIDVTLRLFVLKDTKDGPAKLGIFTNLDPEEYPAREVVEHYVRKWPDPMASHRLFIKNTKSPLYLEDFKSSEQMLTEAKRVGDASEPDHLFAILVDILNDFSKRTFFPEECSSWSLLKMRELFFRKRGVIVRDKADDVLFKLFKTNELQEKDTFALASLKFNEMPIFDASGRKLWFIPQP